MNDPAPQTNDLLPLDVVDRFPEVGRKMRSRLADDLEASRFRTTASDDFSSETKLSLSSPDVYLSIRSIASRMSSTRSRAERLDNESLGANRIPVTGTQRSRGDQGYLAAESDLKEFSEGDELQADRWIDVDEDVDIARGRLLAKGKRAEKRDLPHAEPADQLRLQRTLVVRTSFRDRTRREPV